MIRSRQCLAKGQNFALKLMNTREEEEVARALRERQGLEAVKGVTACMQMHEIIMLPTSMIVIVECAPPLSAYD